jgi:hypothetical protein
VTTRTQSPARYLEIEPWAWARLSRAASDPNEADEAQTGGCSLSLARPGLLLACEELYASALSDTSQRAADTPVASCARAHRQGDFFCFSGFGAESAV